MIPNLIIILIKYGRIWISMSNEEKKYIQKYHQHRLLVFIIQIALVIMFLISWQILSDQKIINPFIFSSPLKILKTINNLIITHQFISNVFTTLKEIIIAYDLA